MERIVEFLAEPKALSDVSLAEKVWYIFLIKRQS